MKTSDVTTPDELYQALIDSNDLMPLVPIKVLVEAIGEQEAKKLAIIKTHEFISRNRAIESIVLQRAMRMLTLEQRAQLFPQQGTENLGETIEVKEVQHPE